MKLDKENNTATYTRGESRILTGNNDIKRDDLKRELRPIIQDLADESGESVNVYFSDGTMDCQVYPNND